MRFADRSIGKPYAKEPAWEQDCIEVPAVCRRDGRFYRFYGGAYNNAPQQIGCAVSDDGSAWERLSDRPFLPNGKLGAWNASESGHPFVFTDAFGNTPLFFQGNDDSGRIWLVRYIVDKNIFSAYNRKHGRNASYCAAGGSQSWGD